MKKSPFFRPSRPQRSTTMIPLRRPTPVAAAAANNSTTAAATVAAAEHKSTVLGTTANLVNAIVGCGIVGIPYAMAQCGILAGIPLLIFVACITERSLRMLMETATYVHAGTYETLAEACFGTFGFRFVALGMFITSYGAMVSYLMIVKDCFSGLILQSSSSSPSLSNSDGEEGEQYYYNYNTKTMRRSILVLISMATVVPLACRRDMADLAFTSRLNVIIDTTLVGIVAVNAVSTASSRHDTGETATTNTFFVQELHSIPAVHWNTIFVGLGVLSFAFVCQHAAFIIAGSLKEPARWSTVTSLALTGCGILALTCGVFGFWGFRDDTKGNILDNLNPNAGSTHIAKFLLGMTMLFVYPLESFVARHVCVVLMFEGRAAHEGNDAYILNRRDRRVLLTLAVYVAAILPAAFFDDLGPVLALTGAIGGSCLSYIGPGAVFLGVHGERFQALVRQAWLVGKSSRLTSEPLDRLEKECTSVTLSIQLQGEVTPLITKSKPNGQPNNNRFIDELQTQLSPFGRLLWTVLGMPLWMQVAEIGGKNVQTYAQDLAAKSPHPIRIESVEHSQQPAAALEQIAEGPALLANGERRHRLVGQSLQKSRISTPTSEPSFRNIGWSEFIIAIGYVLFGFVAMIAGIASLFVEQEKEQ